MTISFSCKCGKELKAKEALAGKRAKCPRCGAVLVIPVPCDGAAVIRSLGAAAAEPSVADRPRDEPSIRPPPLPERSPPPGIEASTDSGEKARETRAICANCRSPLRRVESHGEPTGRVVCPRCDLKAGICPVCGAELGTSFAENCRRCNSWWLSVVHQKIASSHRTPQSDAIIGQSASGDESQQTPSQKTNTLKAIARNLGCVVPILCVVAVVVGLMTLEGPLRMRLIGCLMVLGGVVLLSEPFVETNPYVSFRNSLFFCPVGIACALAGVGALIFGEVPAWFEDFASELLHRLRFVGNP